MGQVKVSPTVGHKGWHRLGHTRCEIGCKGDAHPPHPSIRAASGVNKSWIERWWYCAKKRLHQQHLETKATFQIQAFGQPWQAKFFESTFNTSPLRWDDLVWAQCQNLNSLAAAKDGIHNRHVWRLQQKFSESHFQEMYEIGAAPILEIGSLSQYLIPICHIKASVYHIKASPRELLTFTGQLLLW